LENSPCDSLFERSSKACKTECLEEHVVNSCSILAERERVRGKEPIRL